MKPDDDDNDESMLFQNINLQTLDLTPYKLVSLLHLILILPIKNAFREILQIVHLNHCTN